MVADPSACYWVMLYDPKGEMISKKLFRIFPHEESAGEYLGSRIGKELAIDAFDDMKEPQG